MPVHVGQGANLSKVAAEFAIRQGLVGDTPTPGKRVHGSKVLPLKLNHEDVEAIQQIRDVIM